MHVVDILADPEFARPEVVAAGRRTVLGVPLLHEGGVSGTIGHGSFSPSSVATLPTGKPLLMTRSRAPAMAKGFRRPRPRAGRRHRANIGEAKGQSGGLPRASTISSLREIEPRAQSHPALSPETTLLGISCEMRVEVDPRFPAIVVLPPYSLSELEERTEDEAERYAAE